MPCGTTPCVCSPSGWSTSNSQTPSALLARGRARPSLVQRALLVRASVDGCSTSSMGPAATTHRCGRINCWPSRCPIRCLQPERWPAIVDVVERRLLTPVGLRSLAPGEPDYKPRYDGDLRARDAAYHQGTVWAWLIGPFIDAWLKTHPHQVGASPRVSERLFRHIWAKPASARSAKSSTPKHPTLRAAAWPRPGAWRKLLRSWLVTSSPAEKPNAKRAAAGAKSALFSDAVVPVSTAAPGRWRLALLLRLFLAVLANQIAVGLLIADDRLLDVLPVGGNRVIGGGQNRRQPVHVAIGIGRIVTPAPKYGPNP